MSCLLRFLLVSTIATANALWGCSDITDCAACLNHTVLGSHACYFCEIDQGCHDTTSLVSPCSPSQANDHCITLYSHSACTKKSLSFCKDDAAMQPRQIHIALAGPTGMRITWKTNAKPKSPVVWVSQNFDLDAGKVVKAERSVQYLSSQGPGGHGYHHAAKLEGLKPGTRYEYRIECDGTTSTRRSFETAAEGLHDASFLVLADMGYGNYGQSVATRKRLEAIKNSTAMTLIAGDIAYADDSFVHKDRCSVEFCYETIYDHFMEDMENVTDSKPFMTAVGNHESECHSPACWLSSNIRNSLRNFSAYNARFAMPSPESGGVANMWYSFDYASVHFVVLNTETDFDGAPEENYGDSCAPSKGISCLAAGSFGLKGQYLRWLEADLAAANANRANRPWIIAMGHRPWVMGDYNTGNGTITGDKAVETAHANLFQKYQVDLYLSGHVHSYSRVLPINDNKATPVVITGGAGCDEMVFNPAFDSKGQTADWDWRIMTKETQLGVLHATSETLKWEAIYSNSGDVFDTFTLHKRSTNSSSNVQRVIV